MVVDDVAVCGLFVEFRWFCCAFAVRTESMFRAYATSVHIVVTSVNAACFEL